MNTNLIGKNSSSSYDYLVVGAGLFGSVVAHRLATEKNAKVLVVDKRNHLGGNCHSDIDPKTGIEFHTYGTHIFHTNSKVVWDFLAQFTDFNYYHHQVLTVHQGRVYQLPINLETINSFFNINLMPFEVEAFLERKRIKNDHPQNLEEAALAVVGPELYNAFIKGYTNKQWKCDPKELPPSIFKRLPIRSNYNETYFHHAHYQGIPIDGYTKLFEKLLDHPNIEVRLNCDYFKKRDELSFKEKLIYSGPIDRFFAYEFGVLGWRSVRFEQSYVPYPDYQGIAVMNYADQEVPYTRIHEPVHLHPEKNYNNNESIVFYEYAGNNPHEPYYPIGGETNLAVLRKYQDRAQCESDLIIGGRLGSYSYYDMDQVILMALDLNLS